MSGYNRLWSNINTNIEKRKKDCLHRNAVQVRENKEAIIICMFEISAYYLNEAITRMERK